MTKRNPLSESDKALIRQRVAQGYSRNAIATELHRSGRTISEFAMEDGLTFDNTWYSRQAIETVQEKAARLRAELELKFLEVATESLGEIGKEHLVFSFGGKDNVYEEHVLDHTPSGARLDYVRAADVAMRGSLRLNEYESPGAKAAASLLTALAESLGLDDSTPTA